MEAAKLEVARQDDRSRYDGTCKGRHARLIDAGNEVKSLFPKFNFKAQKIMKALTLSTILPPAITNQFREMMRTLTRVALERFNKSPGNGTGAVDETFPKLRNRFGQEFFQRW